jgi:UDP-N-acetylmuramyl tripeptide synthase
MIKLFEQAIARVRTWPRSRQEDAAQILLAMEAQGTEPYVLTPEEREAVRAALDAAERGDIATEAEVQAMWKKHGV